MENLTKRVVTPCLDRLEHALRLVLLGLGVGCGDIGVHVRVMLGGVLVVVAVVLRALHEIVVELVALRIRVVCKSATIVQALEPI